MSTIHPDEVLKSLKKGARPQKQRNLDIIHQVCAELHRLGSRDFSLATVGRMSEERGGMSQRAIYNKTSAEFQGLIKAWTAFSEMPQKKSEAKAQPAPLAENDLLRKIGDPALRALFGGIIAERNRLRAEINLLKANTNVVIDKRVLPGYVDVTPQGQIVQVLEGTAGLAESEKTALAKAIAPEFLRQEGWVEGENGEIHNNRGRKLFDVGFANAIRKVLNG